MMRPSLRHLFRPGQAPIKFWALPRLFFTGLCLALAFTLLSPKDSLEFGPPSAAADVMQCMESCIKHEGGNSAANKTTCKSRCANIPSVTGGSANSKKDSGSCMSSFKDCQSNCGEKEACERVCKKALMRCQ